MISWAYRRRSLLLACMVFLADVDAARAADVVGRGELLSRVEELQQQIDETALEIGRLSEVGFQERQSSALLQARLREAGFRVEVGIAGMPTAFVASFGTGRPVIGFLAEFDALPGMSQAPLPRPEKLPGAAAGHACGHNLLGSGSVLAAMATASWLKARNFSGTLRVYGAPAEEGGGGKVYLAREGRFNDVDAVMNWHPSSSNASRANSNFAFISGRFTFRGQSSHAAVAPQLGRSALDGVEAMNFMVNMMREHIDEKARIHYAILSSNPAANIVPDLAQVQYIVRHPDARQALELWE